MKNRKQFLCVILACALMAAIFGGCATSGGTSTDSPSASAASADDAPTGATETDDDGGHSYTVGFVNIADTDLFRKQTKDNFAALADADPEVSVMYTDANNDVQKQLDYADNFIAQGVDVLVLVPCDYSGVVPAIEAANSAGIPVVCLGINAESGEYVYVGSENYDSGYMQGVFMAEHLPENSSIVYLAGTSGQSHAVDRRQGTKDALAALGREDVQIVADQDCGYDMFEAIATTEDWLQAFDKIDGVVAANDLMALGAIEALKGANRLDGVLVSGIDGIDDALTAIKNGDMAHSVLQDSQGQATAGYETVRAILDGAKVSEMEAVIVPFKDILPENVDDFM